MDINSLTNFAFAGIILGFLGNKLGRVWTYFTTNYWSKFEFVGEPYEILSKELSTYKSLRNLSWGKLSGTINEHRSIDEVAPGEEDSNKTKRFLPFLGTSYLYTKVNKIRVWLNISEQVHEGGLQDRRITLWCSKKKSVLLQTWAQEILDKTLLSQEKFLRVYKTSHGSYYNVSAILKPKRRINSIINSKNLHYQVLEILKDWEKTEESHIVNGLNFHFGLLIHGTVGTGKTSLAVALASELDRALYMVSNNDDCVKLLGQIPQGSVVLFDECDSLLNTPKDESETGKRNGLANLLTALDGPASVHNTIYIFTTNNRDCLSPSLFRPGRVDYELEFNEKFDNTQLIKKLSFDKKKKEEETLTSK